MHQSPHLLCELYKQINGLLARPAGLEPATHSLEGYMAVELRLVPTGESEGQLIDMWLDIPVTTPQAFDVDGFSQWPFVSQVLAHTRHTGWMGGA